MPSIHDPDPYAAISPETTYTLTEAARVVPAARKGERVAVAVLHRWRREGRIHCTARSDESGRTVQTVTGAELLRHLLSSRRPSSKPREPRR
jgi:hypothetical protein